MSLTLNDILTINHLIADNCLKSKQQNEYGRLLLDQQIAIN